MSPQVVSCAWPSRLRSDSKYLGALSVLSDVHTIPRRRLRHKQRTEVKTADEIFEIKKICGLLTQSIRLYYDCRKVYIPGLTSVDYSEDNDKLETQPEVLKLWVPSQLPAENRSPWCLPGIPDLELRFRYAQADDSLADLRRHI